MNRFLPFLLLFFALKTASQPMSWITPCIDKTFCLNQNSCTVGTVFMVEKAVTNCGSPIINYSYKIDLDNNGSIDIQSSEDTIAGPYARGTHRVYWRATDGCGAAIQCSYLFNIKDCQPPSLLCINGLTQGLDAPVCEETFNVANFVLSMSDNCTPTNQLQLGMRRAGTGSGFPTETSLTFNNCDQGFNAVEVWVRDGNGLTNQCSNYVILQDGNNDCPCNNDADLYLHGCARTLSNTKISTFKLKAVLETLPAAPVPYSKTIAQTISDSCFAMHIDQIPFGGPYKTTLRAERPSGPLVGVTTYDLVLISKHILATEPFTSVYQTLAADVNKSNSVTTFDIVETRKLILGVYDTFPLVPAWRFVRPVADPSQIAALAAVKDTYQISLTNLNDDLTLQNFNFIGIKYGDVNGSATLTGAADDRYDAPPMLLHTADRWLEAGEIADITLRLSAPATLEGWQMVLEAPQASLEILGVAGIGADNFMLHENVLRASWVDAAGQFFGPEQPVLTLKVKALQAVRLSKALFLQTENLRPEAYIPGKAGDTGRCPLRLYFGENAVSDVTFFAPRPNPFSDETVFEMLLEQPAPAQLEVFDLQGRQIFAEAYDLEMGLQTLRLPANALPGTGVFVYRIAAGGVVASGRLVKI